MQKIKITNEDTPLWTFGRLDDTYVANVIIID